MIIFSKRKSAGKLNNNILSSIKEVIKIEDIINDLYITSCGRIFNKKSPYRTIKSFEIVPSLSSTFNRFIKNNNLNKEDFQIIDSGLRNNNNKKLYYYKYKIDTPLYYELHGNIDNYGYKILNYKNRTYKWHRIVCYYFKPINDYKNMQVNHIIPNKLLNSINNLEWCTCQENITHSILNNTRSKHRGPYKKDGIDKLFNENLNWSKIKIRRYLQRRNLKFEDFEFIETNIDIKDNNRKLGYLKK